MARKSIGSSRGTPGITPLNVTIVHKQIQVYTGGDSFTRLRGSRLSNVMVQPAGPQLIGTGEIGIPVALHIMRDE